MNWKRILWGPKIWSKANWIFQDLLKAQILGLWSVATPALPDYFVAGKKQAEFPDTEDFQGETEVDQQ
jgi:hypothetical protein